MTFCECARKLQVMPRREKAAPNSFQSGDGKMESAEGPSVADSSGKLPKFCQARNCLFRRLKIGCPDK
jgi:hypothetical protein